MTWFADKLGPNPRDAAKNGAKTAQAGRPATSQPQAQRAAAPPAPAPEPKKKKGWF